MIKRLNPYYTGRWFLLEYKIGVKVKVKVLILIILEDGFCYEKDLGNKISVRKVLILIILEDGFC